MSRLRRDPYWFDRILEDITATLDPEYPYHLAGARVVVTGTDVAVYVTIPDTVVRFNARQRRPAHYDRTTTVINVVEALAVDDLDQLSPDPPGDIDRELAELDLPPIAGWRVHPEWPEEMIDAAIGKTCQLVAGVLHDVDVAASGLEYSSHRDAIDGATNDVLHNAPQGARCVHRRRQRTVAGASPARVQRPTARTSRNGMAHARPRTMAGPHRRRHRPMHRHDRGNLGRRAHRLIRVESVIAWRGGRRR